jgi:hypothetical protein
MPASLQFTDAQGSAAITNEKPGRGARFAGWTPLGPPAAELATELATPGVVHGFVFGERYEATFRLEYIPNPQVPLIVRLARHLKSGGTVHVITDDAAGREYPTCQMVESAPPTYEKADRALQEWTLTVTLRNVAPVPEEMLCLYE